MICITAPGSPSVAAHDIQLGSLYPALYNPAGFPIYGADFPDPYAPSFQAHPQSVPSQVAPPHRPFLSFQPLAAAGTQVCRRIRITSWHYQQMLKSATDAVTCSQKNFVRHHTTSWSSMWISVWYAGRQHRYTAQTLPTPITTPTLRTLGEKILFLTAVY